MALQWGFACPVEACPFEHTGTEPRLVGRDVLMAQVAFMLAEHFEGVHPDMDVAELSILDVGIAASWIDDE